MGLIDLFLPPRRRRLRNYKLDWNSPELQPIAGVSLQKYVEVTQAVATSGPRTMAGMAELAGVSQGDWTAANAGWQTRLAQSQDVRVAMTKIERPDLGSPYQM